jgi:hypothetical protein
MGRLSAFSALIAQMSEVTDHFPHFGNHVGISSSAMGTIVGTTDGFSESKSDPSH